MSITHVCLIHVIGRKIWIQRNKIEDSITKAPITPRTPKTNIIPAFKPADIRPHTGYATS